MELTATGLEIRDLSIAKKGWLGSSDCILMARWLGCVIIHREERALQPNFDCDVYISLRPSRNQMAHITEKSLAETVSKGAAGLRKEAGHDEASRDLTLWEA